MCDDIEITLEVQLLNLADCNDEDVYVRVY